MKKLSVLITFVCVITVLLTACGNNNSGGSSVNTTPAPPATEINADANGTDTAATVDTVTAAATDYSRGVMTSTGYTSEYLNLSFTLPEGAMMASDDEIQGMMDFGADMAGLDSAMVDYAMLSTVYEMMAVSESMNSNVIVMVEKLPIAAMTLDSYIESFTEQLTLVPGITYSKLSEGTITIAGETYTELEFLVSYNDADFEVTQAYALRKINDRIVGFIFTYTPDTISEKTAFVNAFTTL